MITPMEISDERSKFSTKKSKMHSLSRKVVLEKVTLNPVLKVIKYLKRNLIQNGIKEVVPSG